MKYIKFNTALLVLFFSLSQAQNYTPKFRSDLPKCVGNDIRQWSLCQGSFTFPNGNTYTGEWNNGQREGNGEIRIVARGKLTETYIGSDTPAVYTGEFMGGRMNGHGVMVFDNGKTIEGNFRNNILVTQQK
jgi:hypothetical protein